MATMNAPALRGWAARRLGERLRGGENVDAGQIDALFVDCSAKLAVRHAAALLWHGGGEAIAALLAHNSSMRAGLGVLARLVLAHALLMIANVGDVASANELLQSLLLLPSSVERRVFSRMEEQLVEGLRALCLPAWADETSTREALVLLECRMPPTTPAGTAVRTSASAVRTSSPRRPGSTPPTASSPRCTAARHQLRSQLRYSKLSMGRQSIACCRRSSALASWHVRGTTCPRLPQQVTTRLAAPLELVAICRVAPLVARSASTSL